MCAICSALCFSVPPVRPDLCSVSAVNDVVDVNCSFKDASTPALYHVLEVFDGEETSKLIKQLNNSNLPMFSLHPIDSGGSYVIKIFSVNKLGRSGESIVFLKGNKSTPMPLHISDFKGKNGRTRSIIVNDSPMIIIYPRLSSSSSWRIN